MCLLALSRWFSRVFVCRFYVCVCHLFVILNIRVRLLLAGVAALFWLAKSGLVPSAAIKSQNYDVEPSKIQRSCWSECVVLVSFYRSRMMSKVTHTPSCEGGGHNMQSRGAPQLPNRKRLWFLTKSRALCSGYYFFFFAAFMWFYGLEPYTHAYADYWSLCKVRQGNHKKKVEGTTTFQGQ